MFWTILITTLSLSGILRVRCTTEFEYDIGDIYPQIRNDNYENEMLIRHIMDEDDDIDVGDEEYKDEEYKDDGYRTYSINEKRDLIKGPSFVPTIDDETAESDLKIENNDVSGNVVGMKRSKYVHPSAEVSEVGRKHSRIYSPARNDDGDLKESELAVLMKDDVGYTSHKKSKTNPTSEFLTHHKKYKEVTGEQGNRY